MVVIRPVPQPSQKRTIYIWKDRNYTQKLQQQSFRPGWKRPYMEKDLEPFKPHRLMFQISVALYKTKHQLSTSNISDSPFNQSIISSALNAFICPLSLCIQSSFLLCQKEFWRSLSSLWLIDCFGYCNKAESLVPEVGWHNSNTKYPLVSNKAWTMLRLIMHISAIDLFYPEIMNCLHWKNPVKNRHFSHA